MKKILAVCLTIFAVLNAHAEDTEFGIGSLVIPMDRETQNLENDGIFLAYGLVYQLLGQGYTIHSVIKEGKVNPADPDWEGKNAVASEFITVVNGGGYLPYPVDSLHGSGGVYDSLYGVSDVGMIYRGGPFVIHPENAAAVKAFLADNPQFAAVVVHEHQESNTFDIGVTYDEVPKKIALLQSTVGTEDFTQDVLVCYLQLAGISSDYYDILSQDDIVAGALVVGTYYILWLPHWDLLDQVDSSKASSVVDRIEEFLDAGGNVLSTCRSIDSLAAEGDLLSSSDMAVNESEADLQPTKALYDHNDIPFSQIGNYDFEVDARDTQIFRPYRSGDVELAHSNSANSSKWLTGTQVVAYKYDPSVDMNALGSTAKEDKWGYYALREKDNDDNKGNIHMLAGHQYASCKPTIQPGNIYAFQTKMSDCGSNPKKNFWGQSLPCIKITLWYQTGDKSITLKLCEDDVRGFVPDETTPTGSYTGMTIGNEFMMWAEDPDENPDRFGVNYGSGCSGGGNSKGTDQLGSVYLQNLTDNSNIIITNITVEWSCNGFSGGTSGGGCGTTYQFEEFDIRILDKENGNDACGRKACADCGNVYANGKSCESDGSITFVPKPKLGGDLTFDGGQFSNNDRTIGNVGGLRYIYNTLFNKIQNPINVAEFARSGPIVKKMTVPIGENAEEKTWVYYGTFEYPGNAGHFRAYEATGTGSDLSVVWDAQDQMPSYLERNLFTYINGNKVSLEVANASTIHTYLQDSDYTVDDLAEYIQSFRGKYRLKRLGGIERSSTAIVTPSTRVNSSRKHVAYVGTTYGVLEVIDLADGSELGGYVPAAVLPKLENTATDNVNRPKVDSSPTVLDAFLLKSDQTTEREWKTVLLMGNGSAAGGLSCLDVSDPTNITLMWDKTDTIVPDSTKPPLVVESYGNVHRVSVARYKKRVVDPVTGTVSKTLGYAVIVTSNLPDGNGLAVAGYDLRTGDKLTWIANPLVITYPAPVTNINDIPAAPAIWDTDNDNFHDAAVVGDMAGYLWSVDLTWGKATLLTETLTGTLPNTEARPIGASPSLGTFEGQAAIAYGTGGTSWSNATNNFVRVISYPDGKELLTIDIGSRRIFNPVLIAGSRLIFTAVEGTLGSADPTLDVEEDGEETFLYSVEVVTDDSGNRKVNQSTKVISKTESSLYADQGQTYSGSFDGEVTRHGTQVQSPNTSLFEILYMYDPNNPVPEVKVTPDPTEY